MENDNDYWDHQRPGLRKTVCAWAVLAIVAAVLGLAGLVWPSEPKSIGFSTAQADLGLRARRAFDREHMEDLEISRPGNDQGEDHLDRRDVAFGR